jgi:SET domain-containing protein
MVGMSNVIIKNTKKYGRGLYAARNLDKGEVVEIAPVVVLSQADSRIIGITKLTMYLFEWKNKDAGFALGYGSLFNHSKKENVSYEARFKTNDIVFTAIKKVKKGQQLFIDYGYDPIKEMKIYQKGGE